jgi:adenosylcobyric acid synthase
MNPVLLKPSTDTGAQVVLYGQPLGNREAKEYFSDTNYLYEKASASLERLRTLYALIFMEGAGSCAEVNLRSRDFVNFRMAHVADAPVILVADIDRGGVFAQLIGTLNVIPKEDRRRVAGIIINRFRGDPDLFRTGIEFIEGETGLPVLGLVPYFHHIEIDSEDGLPLDYLLDPPSGPEPGKVNIGVIRLPHISNFTDFSPFERSAFVNLHYLARPRPLYGYDAIFIPGTKNSRFDMEWLNQTGWANSLAEFVGNGGHLGGICGGYQLLGKLIRDPYGIEGTPGETYCLGLLDVETTLHNEKILSRSKGIWERSGENVEGYEIHMGITKRSSNMFPLIRILSNNQIRVDSFDGASTSDGRVWGTYLHGLFDTPGFRHSFLKAICANYNPCEKDSDPDGASNFKDHQYDLLAEHFLAHLDMDKLLKIVGFDKEAAN